MLHRHPEEVIRDKPDGCSNFYTQNWKIEIKQNFEKKSKDPSGSKLRKKDERKLKRQTRRNSGTQSHGA